MGKDIRVNIVGDAGSFKRALGQATGATSSFGSSLNSIVKRGVLGAGAAIVGFGALATKAAIDFESAFTGVRKTVNATEPQFQQLRQGFRDMAKEIPQSVNELAKIGETAGQLGISRKAILGFTRTIADLGETTNLVGDEAASSLARLANVTRMPQSQFRRLGSTIVALGNAGASTEREITDMALRIAGAGKQVGLTVPQILGFSNALSSVGIDAEAGGTAISTAFIKMASAVAGGGKALAGFAKVAGVTTTAFQQQFKTDAAGAMISFVEGLARVKSEGGNVFATLDKLGLGGIRVRDTLLRASGAGDLFRQSLELGNKAWKDNTALTVEAEKRYKTTAAQLKMLHNRWTDLKITIGEKALPVVNDAIKGIVGLAEKVDKQPTLKLKLQVVWDAVSTNVTGLWDKITHDIDVAFHGETKLIQIREGVEVQVTKPTITITWGDVQQQLGNAFNKLLQEGFGGADKANAQIGAALKGWAARQPGEMAAAWRGALNAQDITGDLQKWIVNPLRALATSGAVAGGAGLIAVQIASGIRSHSGGITSAVTSALSRGLAYIRGAAAGTAFGAAVALGARVVAGVRGGLGPVVGAVTSRLNGIVGAIGGAAGRAGAAAVRIGSAIVQGVLGGLGSLYGAVKGKIEGILGSVLGSINIPHRSPPEHAAAEAIGIPLGRGVIRGWVIGTADLPSKMSDTLRNAIEKARSLVEAARTRFSSIFGELSDRILRAFDAESRAHETVTEKLLREQDERRRMEDLIQRQADAQARLNQLVAEGAGAAEIAAAQRDLTRAGEDIARVDLEKKAAEERLQYDSQREELRLHLEKRLAQIEAALSKEGATWQKSVKLIAGVLNSFGVDFAEAGANMGKAFVTGLQNAMAAAVASAGAVSGAVNKAAGGVKTPAPKARQLGGPVGAGRAYVVGEGGPELFVPGSSGDIVPNAAAGAALHIEHYHAFSEADADLIVSRLQRRLAFS